MLNDKLAVQKFLHTIDGISTWIGKAFAWLIIALMMLVVVEVFKRYALNAPTAWIFDASNMLYGTLFMMCGAYALAHDGHVRGDFLYGNFSPRKQATIDLVLYVLFFLPGIAALTWAGWTYFSDAWTINEKTFSAVPIPLYPFKFIIPFAGVTVLLQGFAEMLRCVVCLQTGEWTPRLADAEESDVVAQQLASSEFVDADAKALAIESSKNLKG